MHIKHVTNDIIWAWNIRNYRYVGGVSLGIPVSVSMPNFWIKLSLVGTNFLEKDKFDFPIHIFNVLKLMWRNSDCLSLQILIEREYCKREKTDFEGELSWGPNIIIYMVWVFYIHFIITDYINKQTLHISPLLTRMRHNSTSQEILGPISVLYHEKY